MVVVERREQVPTLLAAERSVVLVSVEWSPWPRKSRQVLSALEDSRAVWSPAGAPVVFCDLWPESEAELHQWYDRLCLSYAPRFELHGHGHGPLWWMAHGEVLECVTKPYEEAVDALQRRSAAVFAPAAGGA